MLSSVIKNSKKTLKKSSTATAVPTKEQKIKKANAALAALKAQKLPSSAYIWFVCPIGSHTNEVLSKTTNILEEGSIICNDSPVKKRFLYRMEDYDAVIALRMSDRYLIFKVYRQQHNGVPELVPELNKV